MKKKCFSLLFAVLTLCSSLSAQPSGRPLTPAAHGLDYYLPSGASLFDSAVPTPEDVLGFNIGERFPEWADVVRYMQALADSSPRVSLKTFGRTFESRPYLQICITSPANQARLEQIRQEHLELTDIAVSGNKDIATMPVVVDIMASIHGREPSGVAATLPVAYYYAATTDPAVTSMLDDMVIVITPGLNPDGINNFATWINTNSSINHFHTPDALEYNEYDHNSRGNHYWQDCNRDWLAAQFDVGKQCVTMYKHWMPNVVLDLHEMTNKKRAGEYYCSPGDPNRTYKYTPQRNQDLTEVISHYTIDALTGIGSTTFSKKGYDDFFIGKGAAYCDLQGSIGILHEQVSTRGHLAQFVGFGPHSFEMTVRNQSYASFAVVRGAYEHRNEFLSYQRQFYVDGDAAACADKAKAYVFDARGNRGIAWNFIDNLRLHGIEVYKAAGQNGKYVVPLRQKNQYLARCIFEDITQYSDSTFYDISTWSQSRAFNIRAALVESMPELGEKIGAAVFEQGSLKVKGTADAFVFSPGEFYAPYMMNALQQKGIRVQVSRSGFTYECREDKVKKTTFVPGTLVVAAEGQKMASDSLRSEVEALCKLCGVDVTGIRENRKFSLASAGLSAVREPRIAIAGTHSITEFWYLFDYHYAMNHAVVDVSFFSGKGVWEHYNTVFTPHALGKKAVDKARKWVEDGGTLVLQGNDAAEFGKAVCGKAPTVTKESRKTKGLVLNAAINHSSPLMWGYEGQDEIAVYRTNAHFWTAPEGADVALSCTSSPYLSGCVRPGDLARLGGTPLAVTVKCGKGSVVYLQDKVFFRAYWLGTAHILSNAAFFGDCL